jgi:hypothetical protein
MNPNAIFLAAIAMAIGCVALAAALYFARSVLRLIYPELRDRPHVLGPPVTVFWRTEFLTPNGREAHRRFVVFASIAIGILPIGAWLSYHSGALDLLHGTLVAVLP